jgi:putative hemolysin
METKLPMALALLGCLALSFVLSGMEAGVFALSRVRIRRQMRLGKASARVLHQFLENPENFLWTIVVGNTLVNFVVLGWFFSALHGRVSLHSGWFALWFLVVVVGFYMFFDLLPKMLFRVYPNRLCLVFAQPFRVLHIGLRPVVAVVEWCARWLLYWTGGRKFSGHLFGNREELRAVTQDFGQVFSSEERLMINRVLDLENLTVRQIAKPLAEAVTISADAPVAEAMKLFRESGHTRLLVWQQRDGVRRIAGLVSAGGLMFNAQPAPPARVADVISPGLFLAEDLRLDVALERLQRGGQRLAIVLGREGQEVGLVGLEDILTAIFGEVRL